MQMSAGARETRNEIAATYLQQLQELGHEILNAMEAIAANALPTFQESVAKQEMLCASLVSKADEVSKGFGSPEQPLFSSIDKAIEAKINAASRAIRDLNLQYAALLRHSGRTIALLSLLCKSHTGQFQEARGVRLKHQTWSCEM
jgi:hypothetical protein